MSFLALYTSPNQAQDQFESVTRSCELTLDKLSQQNPYLVIALGDFNAKPDNWLKNGNTPNEGNEIDLISSNFGLYQIIDELTHITHLHVSIYCLYISQN